MNPINSEADVVVVGGGPGGSTASTFIATQGHRVVLLEKQKMPVYKIGESLLPATVHGICTMLGVGQAMKDANFVKKLGGTFRWGKSQEPWTFLFAASPKMIGPTSTAYQVERMKFDMILLNNAREKGVDVREQHGVTGLIEEDGRVAGVKYTDEKGQTGTIRSRYVVDASGYNTSLARHAGERVYSKFFQNLALFGYFHNAGRMPAPAQGNIFCAAFEHGWFWFIPLSDTLTSVGAVVGKELAAKLTAGYEPAMNEFIQSCPRIRDLLANATRVTEGPYGELRVRKDYSYCNTKFWKPGLMLIGDSACFIDPVFSSGVHLATYSALLAARSINTSLANGLEEARCCEEFEARYRREYANFYDFLLAFYDMEGDLDTYFWQARKVLNSPEVGNRAFIDLVGGVSGSGESLYADTKEFLSERHGLGEVLFPQSSGDPTAGESNEKRRNEFYTNLLGEIVQVRSQASLKDRRPMEQPLFPGGLVATPDGLHWMDPAMVKAVAQ